MTNYAMDPTLSRPSSGIVSPPRIMRSRTQSISSDRPSTIGHGLMSPPLSVSPEAAFIAVSAASQIVTNDHDSHADTWYDQHGIEPAGETAMVSPAALQLVNNFLDQLLFNFLSVARTTTLAALRPAVSEVLKPKLAKDAINQADEELREYLGGGDEDDFVQPRGADPSQDWDLELVWKRTRLRCMVYSSLGDMEEEDEDYYMEQDNLEPGSEDRGAEVISPAVAIFLTSILEFMGEQALVVAGQAAYHRMRGRYEKELKDGVRSPADIADRIVVEELDMERVALDRTLGRLWRAWKKRIRSPVVETSARPFSRDSNRSTLTHARQSSHSEHPLPERRVEETEGETQEQSAKETVEGEVAEWVKASAIPLPIGDHDVDEIEVPGLAAYSDDEDDEGDDEEEELPQRPKSLMVIPYNSYADLPTPTMSRPHSPVFILLPAPPRKRSNSLPTPAASPYTKFTSKTSTVEPISSKLAEEISAAKDDPREISTEEIYEDVEQPTKPGTSAQTSPLTGASIEEDEDVGETPRKRNNREIAMATTAAMAAVAATTTFSKKVAEQESDASDSEAEYEEPKILTSSRVSLGGRSSPSISESAKGVSASSGNLQRSGSVHSARLIDVGGPKSPVQSRNSSVDTLERQRIVNVSRPASGSTRAIAEEKRKLKDIDTTRAGPASAASPVLRSPVEIAIQVRKHNQPISEAEEDVEATLSGRGESTPTTATLSTPTSAGMPPEELQSQIKTSHPIFGSVTRHHEPSSPRSQKSPRDVPPSPSTKVTIISSPYGEEKPAVPSKSPLPTRASPVAIPERSSNRQVNGNAHLPVTNIGVVSIERPKTHQEPPEPDHASPATGARSIHTSGSSGSGGTNRLKPVRTSEESSKANVARNFEELIQSDQTIQYTLTPESMRDIESNQSLHNTSPIMTSRNRKSEDVRMPNERSRASSIVTELKRTASLSHGPVTMLTGLNSHPISHAVAEPKPTPKVGPGSKPPLSGSASKSRMNAPQARDARVPRDSVMDIAEFIRSTGPGGDNTPAPIRGLNGAVPPNMSVDSSRRMSSTLRTRLQARDAAVDSKEDNSDLIDFIRRGPPASSNPRIPRNVAPFRSTMDSDQMTGAVGGRAVDATLPNIRYSQASTNVTDSSFNSQSALLKNKPSYQNGNRFDDEDMMPKRKTRRVKDPYAIDFSDEDEDDYVRSKPPVAAPKEESLADFLKNYAPPPEPSRPPRQQAPKKKASAPNLMGRFGRGGGNAPPPSDMPSMGGPDSRSLNSRGGSKGYIPIQVNMPPGYDKYGPVEVAPNRSLAPTGRVPMKKFEPRDPVSSSSRTSDLADFLKNSGPPSSMGQYSPPIDDRDGSSRAFGRRKKSAYA